MRHSSRRRQVLPRGQLRRRRRHAACAPRALQCRSHDRHRLRAGSDRGRRGQGPRARYEWPPAHRRFVHTSRRRGTQRHRAAADERCARHDLRAWCGFRWRRGQCPRARQRRSHRRRRAFNSYAGAAATNFVRINRDRRARCHVRGQRCRCTFSTTATPSPCTRATRCWSVAGPPSVHRRCAGSTPTARLTRRSMSRARARTESFRPSSCADDLEDLRRRRLWQLQRLVTGSLVRLNPTARSTPRSAGGSSVVGSGSVHAIALASDGSLAIGGGFDIVRAAWRGANVRAWRAMARSTRRSTRAARTGMAGGGYSSPLRRRLYLPSRRHGHRRGEFTSYDGTERAAKRAFLQPPASSIRVSPAIRRAGVVKVVRAGA